MNKFKDLYETKLKEHLCKSNARLRLELPQIFTGFSCTYDIDQKSIYVCQLDTETPLMQKDWRWDTVLRRVWKLCPSKWHRDSVDNTRHPLDVLADLDLYSDGIQELSQHVAWCMDVIYTEAAKRTGFMKKGKHYIAIGNGTYSQAEDALLTTAQKTAFTWSGADNDDGRTPSRKTRGNILEASATIALITEPQQTVWLRYLLLKCFEISLGNEAVDVPMKSYDWLDEPLTKNYHPHMFPLKMP